MLSEFIYSMLIIEILIACIILLNKNINSSYKEHIYFNEGIHKYFNEEICKNGLKCSKDKLLYKNLKVNIKTYNNKSIFTGVQDELISKIYKKLEEKNINISKQ